MIETFGKVNGHMFLMPMDDFKAAFDEFAPTGKKMLLDGTPDEIFASEYTKILEAHKRKER